MTSQTPTPLPSLRRRFVIDRDGECRYINVEFTPKARACRPRPQKVIGKPEMFWPSAGDPPVRGKQSNVKSGRHCGKNLAHTH